MGEGEGRQARRPRRRRGHAGAGSPRQQAHARAQNARPLRQPYRLGGAAPGLARADGAGLRASRCIRSPGRRASPAATSRGACCAYIWNQIENGVGCPLGMTYAAFPGLSQPEFGGWREKILSARYDKRPLPYRAKSGATIGYAMTEKQGGSDLRQTQTTARFAEATSDGRAYLLNGHKWFFSVPAVGRVLHPGAGQGRRDVLLRAGLPARRHAQRRPPAAPQGQVRQPLQRLERDRVSRCAGMAGRRGRRRHPRDPLATRT